MNIQANGVTEDRSVTIERSGARSGQSHDAAKVRRTCESSCVRSRLFRKGNRVSTKKTHTIRSELAHG